MDTVPPSSTHIAYAYCGRFQDKTTSLGPLKRLTGEIVTLLSIFIKGAKNLGFVFAKTSQQKILENQ
jgi:hypothetical protein